MSTTATIISGLVALLIALATMEDEPQRTDCTDKDERSIECPSEDK